MKAYFRELDNRYHIRYVDQSGKHQPTEFVEPFYKHTFSEKDVKQRIEHINYKIKFSDFDPWEEREKEKKQHHLSRPLGMLIDKFIEMNVRAENWLPQTRKGYDSRLSILQKGIGKGTAAKELTEESLQRWLNELDVAPITKRSYSKEFNVFFKWLFENDYIQEQIHIGPTNLEKQEIRNTDKIKYITFEELKRMEAGYRWKVRQNKKMGKLREDFNADKHVDAWFFMFWQLLRKTELPKITPNDIKGDKVRIRGKGNRTDWIYMVPPAQKIAQRRLELTENADAPLFGIKAPSTLYHTFRKASHLALGEEHPSGLHQLRHGGVTHYISLGKPIQFVSKLARHKSIRITTEVYADVLPDRIEDVFSDVKGEAI